MQVEEEDVAVQGVGATNALVEDNDRAAVIKRNIIAEDGMECLIGR